MAGRCILSCIVQNLLTHIGQPGLTVSAKAARLISVTEHRTDDLLIDVVGGDTSGDSGYTKQRAQASSSLTVHLRHSCHLLRHMC